MTSRSLCALLLLSASVNGVKVPPRLRRSTLEDGLAKVEDEAAEPFKGKGQNRLLGEDGLIETSDCRMLSDVGGAVDHDDTEEQCLNTMTCGGGCCRIYNYMTCDEDNSLMHLQCVCNANTRSTGIYEGSTITVDGLTNTYESDVVVNSAFAAGSGGDEKEEKAGKGKGGKEGKGKGKDSTSSSTGVVSNAVAPPSVPAYVPPPEANGAVITGISVTSNNGGAPAPAPGISNTVISSAVGAPGSTTTTVTGTNGATATVTTTNTAPGPAPGGPATGSSPGPGVDPVEQVQGADGDIAAQMAAIIDQVQGSQPVDATVAVNGNPLPAPAPAPGPANEPVISSAMGNPDGADGIGAAMAEIIGAVQGAPAPAPDEPVVSSAMGNPNDAPPVPVTTGNGHGNGNAGGNGNGNGNGNSNGNGNGNPESHVPSNACENGSYLSGMTGYVDCTSTEGQCNQAAGECCLAVYCVCGRPNGGIPGRCVPPYDIDLLTFN